MRLVRIESRFLEPKAFYFFYYAALAALQPYLALYYRSLGLTGSAIGILSAILRWWRWLVARCGLPWPTATALIASCSLPLRPAPLCWVMRSPWCRVWQPSCCWWHFMPPPERPL